MKEIINSLNKDLKEKDSELEELTNKTEELIEQC